MAGRPENPGEHPALSFRERIAPPPETGVGRGIGGVVGTRARPADDPTERGHMRAQAMMIHRQVVCRPKGPGVEIEQSNAGAKLTPEPGYRLLDDIRRVVVRETKADREGVEILTAPGLQRNDLALETPLLLGHNHGLGVEWKLVEHCLLDHDIHIDAA